MNEVTIKTSQSEGQPLSPVGNDIPDATTQVAENGTKRNVDTGAKLVDDRTHHQIFDDLLAAGKLDACENANQVNKAIAEVKGDGKVSTYFVNQRAHGWQRVNGKWVAPTKEWLAANPYVAGTRTSAVAKGMLSDTEVASIKAQLDALDLVPEAGKASVQPIVDGLNAKLVAHREAVEAAAITRERIHARRDACACLERVLRAVDSMGGAWNATLYASLITLGAAIPEEQLAACLFGYPESK